MSASVRLWEMLRLETGLSIPYTGSGRVEGLKKQTLSRC